jgi:hypothetical protein
MTKGERMKKFTKSQILGPEFSMMKVHLWSNRSSDYKELWVQMIVQPPVISHRLAIVLGFFEG